MIAQVFCESAWRPYVESLSWQRGRLDESSYSALLRAGTLKIEPQTAFDTVAERIREAGGQIRERKLKSQLARAYSYAEASVSQTALAYPPRPKPAFSPEKLSRFAAKIPGADADYLEARSKFTCWNRSPAGFLHKLYKPGEKVVLFNVFASQGCQVWEHPGLTGDGACLDYLRSGQPGVWFMANPVDGRYHWNPRQRVQSRRSEEAVTNWRYVVVESDGAPGGQWLSALVQFALPIAAIYSSGGKSVHALARIDAESKSHWDQIVRELRPGLVTLGADLQALTAVRLTRLPACMREETGRLQKLLYLDDAPDGAPICDKPIQQRKAKFNVI